MKRAIAIALCAAGLLFAHPNDTDAKGPGAYNAGYRDGYAACERYWTKNHCENMYQNLELGKTTFEQVRNWERNGVGYGQLWVTP